ncbi:TetR/AcrR family transcriptional regulator [Actinophytocola oryzae]|uniref:TetR family transcriptional regulator n=1 Tax=Actinophytocola oryzae TaxID=502181 RepID=A0A4R7VNR5_9PSEU|nr:TetR/AcrR family transcriptional regulator [Actinophytocola oryzae]TDV50857.1 TetR family transcriptional regulator [Actinophytocola oryzae]
MATQVPLRKQPVQQRSAKRVEQMLEACAALIDELGYDGVTTTLIAERAGVAVGSLYQFFPDKRAVVQALTKRHLDHFTEQIEERLDWANLEHWWHGVDTIIDIYVEMYRTIPGFGRVRFGDVIDLRFIEDGRDNNTVISEQIAHVVAGNNDIPVESLFKQITVACDIGDAILALAFRRKLFDEEDMIAEAKQVVRAYLAGQLMYQEKD